MEFNKYLQVKQKPKIRVGKDYQAKIPIFTSNITNKDILKAQNLVKNENITDNNSNNENLQVYILENKSDSEEEKPVKKRRIE